MGFSYDIKSNVEIINRNNHTFGSGSAGQTHVVSGIVTTPGLAHAFYALETEHFSSSGTPFQTVTLGISAISESDDNVTYIPLQLGAYSGDFATNSNSTTSLNNPYTFIGVLPTKKYLSVTVITRRGIPSTPGTFHIRSSLFEVRFPIVVPGKG